MNHLLYWQVYKQADDEWQLEKSDSLAVLQSHRAAMEALLADVKYDKIAHVRQVSVAPWHSVPSVYGMAYSDDCLADQQPGSIATGTLEASGAFNANFLRPQHNSQPRTPAARSAGPIFVFMSWVMLIKCRRSMCSSDVQAAQKAIAEMQRIPMPSLPGADPRLEEASEHGSASGSSAFTTDSQLQENGDTAGQQKQGMDLVLD